MVGQEIDWFLRLWGLGNTRPRLFHKSIKERERESFSIALLSNSFKPVPYLTVQWFKGCLYLVSNEIILLEYGIEVLALATSQNATGIQRLACADWINWVVCTLQWCMLVTHALFTANPYLWNSYDQSFICPNWSREAFGLHRLVKWISGSWFSSNPKIC